MIDWWLHILRGEQNSLSLEWGAWEVTYNEKGPNIDFPCQVKQNNSNSNEKWRAKAVLRQRRRKNKGVCYTKWEKTQGEKFWEVTAVIQMFPSKQMKEFEKQVINSSECVETAFLALAENEKTWKLHRCREKLSRADTIHCQSSIHSPTYFLTAVCFWSGIYCSSQSHLASWEADPLSPSPGPFKPMIAIPFPKAVFGLGRDLVPNLLRKT